MKKIATLVCSCDKYSDLWYPFFTLYKKYSGNLDSDIYLATETKSKCDFIDVNMLPTGNLQWGERIRKAIRQIDSEYLLVLLDDFFIRGEINSEEIEEVMALMDCNKNIGCCYLYPTDEQFSKQFIDSKLSSKFKEAKSTANYKLNLQAAIWRKEVLYNCIKDFYTPWDFELFGSRIEIMNNHKFLFLKKEEKQIVNYRPETCEWGVVNGKWAVNDVKPLFEMNNIIIDYSLRGLFEGKQSVNKSVLSYYFDFIRRYIKWRILIK